MKIEKNKLAEIKDVIYVSKRLLGFLWETDKWILLGNITALTIPAVIPFVNAYIYKLIIDLIVKAQNTPFDYSQLYKLLALRFVTLCIQNLAFSLQSFMDNLIWTKIPVNLFQLVLSKLAGLDLEYFENSKFKDTLQRVKEGYIWRPLNLYSSLFYTFQSIIQLTIALIAISTLNLALAAGLILAALPAFITQVYYSKTLWGVWAQNSPYRKRFWYLSELIQSREGAKEMKIFQTASKFLKEISSMQKKFAKHNIAVGRKRLGASALLNFFGAAVAIAIEGFVAILAIGGKITLGSLSYFTFVIFNFEQSANGFFQNIANVFNHSLYVKDIVKVLDMPKIIDSGKLKIKNSKKAPKIEFRNVTFAYSDSKNPVLANFSLTIKPGERIAFVGQNGVGKTTIIKLLARFYDVNKGEILIDGKNIKNLDLMSWHKMLGVIFQDFIKYEYTLGQNIHFGKVYEDFDLKKIKTAAQMAGANQLANKFGQGYDQMLGLTFEGGEELSLGQWQKVALARAFLRDAPILVLDEPTASVDAKSEKEIFDKVEKLSRNKTVIIISHRFSTVRNADTIYVLEKGKIIEKGNHQQLLKKDGTYAQLFKLQAQRYK